MGYYRDYVETNSEAILEDWLRYVDKINDVREEYGLKPLTNMESLHLHLAENYQEFERAWVDNRDYEPNENDLEF